MAQLSRPFQIALAALGLLVAVWFLALHGHSTSTSSSTPSAATPAPSAQAQKAGAPSPIYHGSAPGVEGLTRAVAKAHGAVATSQQNAKQLEEKSAQASSVTAPARSSATGGTAAASGKPAAATAAGAQTLHTSAKSAVHKSASAVHKGASTAHKGASVKAAKGLPGAQAPQLAVEAEIKQGKIVLLLFWNPKGADDAIVRNEVRALVGHAKKIALHVALANQVATFGTITRGVQVEQTPTILIINKRGRARALTGFTDVFSLEQAIAEARRS